MKKNRIAVRKSKPQTVVSHLEELRRRLLVCLVVFFLLFLLIVAFPSFNNSFGAMLMLFLKNQFLQSSAASGLGLVFLDPLEPVLTVLKLSAMFVLFLMSPFIIYQAYAFVAPAFTVKSRGLLIIFSLGAMLFLLFGIVFSSLLLIPASFKILINFGLSTGALPVLSMAKFFDMLIWMLLLFSLPFELPIVIGVLAKAGLVDHKMLTKLRKPGYVALAIFSAAATPDPTPFSMLILWALLVVLFEFGVLLARFFKKGENK